MSATTPTTTPSSKCWGTGPSATTSKKKPSHGAWELVVERWGLPRRATLRDRLLTQRRRSLLSIRPRSLRDLGQGLSETKPASTPPNPHRQRQRRRQLLENGRHRTVRPLLRTPRRHDTRTATPAAPSSTWTPTSASRSGTSSSSNTTPKKTAPTATSPPNTSTPAWGSSAPARSSKTPRGFTDFSEKAHQLRHRRLPAHLP